MTGGSSGRAALVFVSAALVVVVVLVYRNACTGEFVFDNAPILADYRLRDAAHLPLILFKDYWFGYSPSRLWRPLTTLSYFLNYTVLDNQGEPFWYHAINICLHALNAVLVLRLLEKLSGNRWVAIAGAALFAVHPIATESVTNIIGRADLLATAGVLTSLLFAWRGQALLAQLAFLVGLLSKESAVVAPAWLAAWMLLRPTDPTVPPRPAWRATLLALIPYGITLSIYLAARAWILQGILETYVREENFLIGLPWLTQRLTAIKAFAIGLSRIVWPLTLSADYSYDQIPAVTSLADAWMLGGVAVLIGAAYLLARGRDRTTRCAVAWFLLGYLPVSNFAFEIGTGLGERLFYLPSVGLVALVALAGRSLFARLRLAPWIVAAATIPLFVLLAGRTYARNQAWSDTQTFWEQTVRDSPRSVRALRTLARALLMRAPNDVSRPIELLERAVVIAPDEVESNASLAFALARRAEVHLQARDVSTAGTDIVRAKQILAVARHSEALVPRPAEAPLHGSAELSRAEAFVAIAEVDGARALGRPAPPASEIEWFLRKSIALEPGYATYSLELAGLLLGSDRPEDAAATVVGLLLLNPSPQGPTAALLSQAYRAAQLPIEAFFHLTRGIRLEANPSASPEQVAKHRRILQAAFASTIQLLRAGGHADHVARIFTAAQRQGLASPVVDAAAHAPLTTAKPWTRYDEVR